MEWILMAILLVPMAVKDMKTKRLDSRWMAAAGVTGLIWNFTYRSWGWYDIVAGAAVGVGLIVVSRLTDRIGLGDGMLFVSVGMICGGKISFSLLLGGLCCCVPAVIFLKLVKHIEGDYEIPFVPFVLAAWMIQNGLRIVR